MEKLSKKEVELVVHKIKSKYQKIIKDFDKPDDSLLENFSQRYIGALKARINISMFLMAEIEAVEEIYKNEEKRRDELRAGRNRKKGKSIADKIFEENLARIKKYPRIELTQEAEEDIEYLCGAIRFFITNYWPVITLIFQEERQSTAALKINEFHHLLISQFDTKGPVPIARHYVTAMGFGASHFKKVDFEYRKILQETGFLCNDILQVFKQVMSQDKLPWPGRKVLFRNARLIEPVVINLFSGKTYATSFDMVFQKLEDIIIDFRLKDFKRK